MKTVFLTERPDVAIDDKSASAKAQTAMAKVEAKKSKPEQKYRGMHVTSMRKRAKRKAYRMTRTHREARIKNRISEDML